MKNAQNPQEEVRIMQQLLAELVDQGYPPESIVTYWEKYGHIYDVAIIDPKTGELIAVLCLNIPNRLMSSSTELRKNITAYLNLKASTNIPFFHLVKNHSGFTVSQFVRRGDSEEGTFVPLRKIPNYEDTKLNSLGRKRKSTICIIRVICWVWAVIASIGLIVDVSIDCLEFTTIHMSLFGLIIALSLFPFVNKLKIFNIEFERKE